MCDLNQDIKFCACRNLAADNSHFSSWTLKRYIDQDWTKLEIGRCNMTAYKNSEQANAELIWLHLNTQDCFDFNYKPENGDILNIKTAVDTNETVKYEFTFTDNQWQLAESISDHFNAKLVIHKGYLKNDAT